MIIAVSASTRIRFGLSPTSAAMILPEEAIRAILGPETDFRPADIESNYRSMPNATSTVSNE